MEILNTQQEVAQEKYRLEIGEGILHLMIEIGKQIAQESKYKTSFPEN